MIELFTIFGKGGIVLWCFQEGAQFFQDSINTLIREVVMQERGDVTQFKHQNMTLKFKLDNEFELVFLVVYQSIVQLSYSDKLLDDVAARFRDLYKNVLEDKQNLILSACKSKSFSSFDGEFKEIFDECMRSALNEKQAVRAPRTFQESAKSQKTVDSLIISRAGDKKKGKEDKGKGKPIPSSPLSSDASPLGSAPSSPKSDDDEDLKKKRDEFFKKMNKGKGGPKSPVIGGAGEKKEEKKKGKAARVWDLAGKPADAAVLDYSQSGEAGQANEQQEDTKFIDEHRQFVGRSAALQGLAETDSEGEESEDEDDTPRASSGGWLGAFRGLVGSKKIQAADVEPVLEQMKEQLILKNVAAEPAEKICQSVARKLDGKVIGTFSRVASEVKTAVRESLTQLLTPKRRVDILRDVVEAKREQRPYVIVFCGVNGVGKSTNLAKITFWLAENGHRILIAAGDTFRAGAVEQLRTHTKHLNALHPNSVQLYEQGYGKDPAGLAAAAIGIAAERGIDVVLVDTAGRMQDNEPLMRALAKLIRVNEPDLCLFVGEALVGNEAVDQLVKFNQALADHAVPGSTPRLIDGIVLTKFDTIDDKVGAAISMTYITGQPIVFVGCGQTYADLRSLNAGAVVNALMK